MGNFVELDTADAIRRRKFWPVENSTAKIFFFNGENSTAEKKFDGEKFDVIRLNSLAKIFFFNGEFLAVEKNFDGEKFDGENYIFDGEKLLFAVENPKIKEKPFLCILDHRLRYF